MHSYVAGIFPVKELIRFRKELVLVVYLSQDSKYEGTLRSFAGELNKAGIRYEYNQKIIDKLASKENTQCIALFNKFESSLEKGSNHILLFQPRNAGNVGTIIRTMLGLGFKNLAIIKDACDIFNPSVVRSTMGAVFGINFEYFESFDDYRSKYPNQNHYLTMLDRDSKLATEVEFEEPYSLGFGNEGAGISKSEVQESKTIFLPQTKEIDSYNLSVAAALTMYIASNKK